MALFKAGDAIGVDALTYSGFSALASMLGIGLVPMEADERGMNPERLEAACAKALFYTPRPSYKSIQTILKSGQDKKSDDETPASSQYGFTRGADYYKGGRD